MTAPVTLADYRAIYESLRMSASRGSPPCDADLTTDHPAFERRIMPDVDPLDLTDDLKALAHEHSPEQRGLHFGCDHQDAPCQVRGEQHRPCPSYLRYLCEQCREAP